MSSDFFQDTQGNLWWADLDAISTMLRSWSQAKAYNETISVVEQNGLQELNFDATRFRRERERLHQIEIGSVSEHIYTAPDRVVTQLVGRYQDIPRQEEEKSRTFRRVQSHNNRIITDRVTMAERTVTALQFTRDASAAIFMCCIPVSGLGAGAAMAARLAGSVFQGVANYQDNGNVGAAIATGVFSFKSSLMVLPATATRGAQILFSIVNTGNRTVANTAINMMTVENRNASTFTDVLRGQLVNAGFDAASGQVLGAINSRLGGTVLPIVVEQVGGQAASALAGQVNSALGSSSSPGGSASPAVAAARIQQRLARERASATEAAWQSTPFYRFMATGDPTALLSEAQQYVMGNMLRRGD